MKKRSTQLIRRAGILPVLAGICVFSINVLAQSSTGTNPLNGDKQDNPIFASDAAVNPPLPLMSNNGGLNINRESVKRERLQLRLSNPLTLTMGSASANIGNSGQVVGLDATLEIPLSQTSVGDVTMTGGVIQQMGAMEFQTLGNIECLNGQLSDYSYTASDCRFVDAVSNQVQQQKIEFGTQFETDNTSTSISWFTDDTSWNSTNVRRYNSANGYSGISSASLAPLLSPLLPSANSAGPLAGMDNNVSGVDLRFQLGITTDNAGDIRFGLQFTRVLDAELQGSYGGGFNSGTAAALPWKVAKPFNSAAANIEWSRGAFSSGIASYYREPVKFLNRSTVNGAATFDVHFTWRAPWNANLSVGATNVLGAGVDETNVIDSQPVDPFESIYGRIPYVRYKQDL